MNSEPPSAAPTRPIAHARTARAARSSGPTAVVAPPGRTSGGLGRGLAGILGDVQPTLVSRRRGLQQLLGRRLEHSLPRVRQFVTDTALAAIADGFGADAVVIARRDGIGLPAVVSNRIPPSWEERPGLTFELFGQLWRLLDEAVEAEGGPQAGGPGPDGRVVEVGEQQVWLGHQITVEGHLVAAVARPQTFSPPEQRTLARLVRSLAVAVGAGGAVLPDGAVESLHLDGSGDRHRVELSLRLGGRRSRARSEGATTEIAVARAAAACWGPGCEVAFAGRTGLDGVEVTVVVVDDGPARPLLGIAVTAPGDPAGPIEAVISAMSVVGPPVEAA